MKATIRGREVELSDFTVMVRGEKGHDEAMEIIQDLHLRDDCRYDSMWPENITVTEPPQMRLHVHFTDPCLRAPNGESSDRRQKGGTK